MTEPNLVAFLGGVAASGAKYKVEVILVGNGIYQADAYSAGGSTAWTRPTLIERSALQPVLAKALAKFAAKTVPGRDRTYDMPLTGLPSAGPIGKALVGGDLPNHPLAWEVGRSLLNLPREYHDRAVLRPGQAAAPVAAAGPVPPPVATPVSTAPAVGSRTDLGQLVMLCETLNTEPELMRLLHHDGWLMTEKMEGDRGQLHYDLNGDIYLTNRSGEVVNCPPHIAEAMRIQRPGTSFDGEVITVDADGAAQLYVGARADIQLFVAFDLVAHPNFRSGIIRIEQKRRMQEMSQLLPPFLTPLPRHGAAIRSVRWVERYDHKLELLAEVRRRSGEGWVLRNSDAEYQGRRSADWMRYRDREKEIDVVVLDYKRGTGKFLNTVGGVKVGLYDARGQIQSIGYVGSGWTDVQRDDFWGRWQRGENGFVITIKSFGLSFADQVIRPSGVHIRTPGDKQAYECTFASEVGREHGAIKAPPKKRP
jgi:hypothetical protein